MTQLLTQTTAKTARNLHQAFTTITLESVEKADLTTTFWHHCNKQKFDNLYDNNTSFQQMLKQPKQLLDFKNSLLKLKNYCSRNQDHQEITLTIVTNQQHKHWIRALS
ncbi:hypothetical protein XF24_00030 [candidate division SR1 bacterium Aalborg_AAW-1]|nr:hypothetical protein XF24_00030 [candidate division SR1 bacterium Aalborg_AAW-1]